MTNQEEMPRESEQSGEVIPVDFAKNRREHDPREQQAEGLRREIDMLAAKYSVLMREADEIINRSLPALEEELRLVEKELKEAQPLEKDAEIIDFPNKKVS